MISRLVRRARLPVAVAALVLALGTLATVAVPAGAATRQDHVSNLANAPLAHAADSRAGTVQTGFEVFNHHSGLCLGINGDKNDQPAVQWGCVLHNDQFWYFTGPNPSHPGYYHLENLINSCLGVAGGSKTKGARVVGWTCYGAKHPDQYWTETEVGNPCGTVLKNLNSGYVLGVDDNSTKYGAAVVQWPYQGVCNNQFWSLPLD